MTAALVWLGFVLGLRHAIEPDHLTAVAALSSRGVQARGVARIAGAWGLGHATVLFATGVALVWTGARWPPAVAAALELAAGLMLVWLGADVLRRIVVAPPAVATAAATSHGASAPAFATRAFLVGGVHGVEGSGAVVLLALPSVRSPGAAAVYLGAFGLGSVAGMIACSFAVTLPLGLAARRLARRARQLQLVVGVSSIAVGAAMAAGYIRSIFR